VLESALSRSDPLGSRIRKSECKRQPQVAESDDHLPSIRSSPAVRHVWHEGCPDPTLGLLSKG
jgi:hypothetical protein